MYLLDCASRSCVLGIVEKLSSRRYAWAWFCGVPTYDAKVMDF